MYTLIPAKKIKKKTGEGGKFGPWHPFLFRSEHVNRHNACQPEYFHRATLQIYSLTRWGFIHFKSKRMHKQYVYAFLGELQLKWDSDYQILQWDIRPLLWKNTLPIRSSKEKNRNQTLCISDMYTCISFRAHIGVNQFKEMQHCESYRIYITACP